MAFTSLSWADRRRGIIIGGAVLAGLTLIAGIIIAVMYDVPTCTDGTQNADETGVDCGGSCAYLCRADIEAPRVTFARAVVSGGRTDVIAYVENRNRDAEADDAHYTLELFDESGSPLAKREGVVDMPARSIVPIFVPGLLNGISVAPRTFVSFDGDTKWRTPKTGDAPLTATNVQMSLGPQPRVTASVNNPGPDTAYGRTVVATVFDTDGQATAASKTVVRAVPGFASADVVFTWPEPFSGAAMKVEVSVLPVLP